jgi:polar amino acid transport system substrate-binding protein
VPVPPKGQDDIKLVPWARGYHLVQTTENTILLSTTRIEEREKMFKWVGPIFQNTSGLIAKKARGLKIGGVEDIRKYKVGTVIEDVGEQYLQKLGIGQEVMDQTNSILSNVKKLDVGRIDMIANGWRGFIADAKSLGIDPDLYEMVYVLNKADLDYAFHTATQDWIIEELQKTMDELKAEGKLKELEQKYGL